MVKLPKILLVHLKRFSYEKDKSVKMLDQVEFPRKFENYRLVGFICHIGRFAMSGHYVYYGRK